MKNKVKRRDFSCIFNSQFMTASPLVQSDFSVYWSGGNLQEPLLLFLLLCVGKYSGEKIVKEKWDFRTS